MRQLVVIGGGPGGYEAALMARHHGADVVLIEKEFVGGSAVMTDCVPSKALIAISGAQILEVIGKRMKIAPLPLAEINKRICELAKKTSEDIAKELVENGVEVLSGSARFLSRNSVEVNSQQIIEAENIIIATGASPRISQSALPDGERILTWKQLYSLNDYPEKLIVVGSGVTGAEIASAYNALNVDVTLVSSRENVLPGEDPDAVIALEKVFQKRGMNVLFKSRMKSVTRKDDFVNVALENGDVVTGSHVVLAIGSEPNIVELGMEKIDIELTKSKHIKVDKVSRTSAQGIYAVGDVTGVLPLASVAATQGRIAVCHALGETVIPFNVHSVSRNIFTHPEVASVGYTHDEIIKEGFSVRSHLLPLAGNPRAKMTGNEDGLIKIFARKSSNIIIGGVVVSTNASELILPIAMAVEHMMTVDQLAHAFTVYPSLSASIPEAARQM